MDHTKKMLFSAIDSMRDEALLMADEIFDNPEIGGKEFKASQLLVNALKSNGFDTELGIGGLPTAFRATWNQGNDGVSIGLLCEYDAIEGLGHGCAHHMQGPACITAALALKDILKDKNYKLVVYGTPAEETFGGKINMLQQGCFQDIDIALMMHGGPNTCTDIKSLAMSEYIVTFKGKSAHAAIAPEQGRSAFDALLLSFNGIEFLREHVSDDVRIHYTIEELPGPNNVIPDNSIGSFALRAESRESLDDIISRFEDIIKGAALMAGVSFTIENKSSYDNKIPVLCLNDCLMENAVLCGAPGIAESRKKTGSTDFGNILHRMPGSCIRVQFVPSNTSSHSQEFLNQGKTKAGHDAIIYGAKILAGTTYDLINNSALQERVLEEFEQRSEKKRFK